MYNVNAYRFWPVLLLSALVPLLLSAPAAAVQREVSAGTGLDQRVNAGARVVLMGNGWSNKGRVVRFRWRQIDGPRIRLRDANRSTSNFVAPRVTSTTVLKFELTVTDIHGRSGSSTVKITVEPPGKPRLTDTSDTLEVQ